MSLYPVNMYVYVFWKSFKRISGRIITISYKKIQTNDYSGHCLWLNMLGLLIIPSETITVHSNLIYFFLCIFVFFLFLRIKVLYQNRFLQSLVFGQMLKFKSRVILKCNSTFFCTKELLWYSIEKKKCKSMFGKLCLLCNIK